MAVRSTGTTNGAASSSEMQESHMQALLAELRICERDGKKERIKAIKAELGEAAKDAEPPSKRAAKR